METIFKGGATFSRAESGGDGLFQGATFEGDQQVVFSEASFGVDLYCPGATFEGPVDLTSTSCNGSINFRGATFKASALFSFAQSAANFICTEARFTGEVSFNTLQCDGSGFFRGARFEGSEEVDFAFSSFGMNLYCSDATFEGPVDFGSGVCNGFMRFDRAIFYKPVKFESARCNGSVFFTKARFRGGANFSFMQSTTDFSCRKARFLGAVSFNTLQCGGSGLFGGAQFEGSGGTDFAFASFVRNLYCPNTTFEGSVGFGSVKCGGFAEFRGASFEVKADFSNIECGAATFHDAAFLGNQQVDFSEASFGTDLHCSGTVFESGANLSSVQCGGSVTLREASFRGQLLLRGAKIGGDLDCTGARMYNPYGEALVGERCQIEGILRFNLVEPATGGVSFRYAQAGWLIDSTDSWPDNFTLVGFVYHSLGGEDRLDLSQRLDWISRSKPFSPDVYTHLAEVFRRTGQEGHARRVAIARERARGRQLSHNLWVKAWDRFLSLTVAYGYQPWRALLPFVILLAVGWLLFSLPVAQEVMVSSPHNYRVLDSAAAPCYDYPCFSPLVYALDLLLPIIDLHQESNWVPASERPWGLWYEALVWVLIAAGWILTTAVVAGIGSLWRRE